VLSDALCNFCIRAITQNQFHHHGRLLIITANKTCLTRILLHKTQRLHKKQSETPKSAKFLKNSPWVHKEIAPYSKHNKFNTQC